MSDKREVFVSVDVETSGPIPGEFSLLSIGACSIFNPEKTFTCKLKPITDAFDPKALEVTGRSMEELMTCGQEPHLAMSSFSLWLSSLIDSGDSIVFVGFNAPFDWSFVNYYFHRFLGKNPFGFTALDIKALYMGATGCSWHNTRSSKIAEHLNPKLSGTHNALQDAQFQAEIFRSIWRDLVVNQVRQSQAD